MANLEQQPASAVAEQASKLANVTRAPETKAEGPEVSADVLDGSRIDAPDQLSASYASYFEQSVIKPAQARMDAVKQNAV